MVQLKSPHRVAASNIILSTAVLSVCQYIAVGNFTSLTLFGAIFGVAFIFVLAFLARQGYTWFKWVYAILVALEILSLPKTLPMFFKINVIAISIYGLHIILQAIAVILLFMEPQKPIPDILDQDVSN